MPPSPEPPYIADRDLYLTKDGRVVEATDPARLTVLVFAGGSLSAARARELGLIPEKSATRDQAPAPEEDAPTTAPTTNRDQTPKPAAREAEPESETRAKKK